MKTIDLNLGVVSISDFDLEKAICNHGQFMMPPNEWIPSSKTLQRPLRLSNSRSSVLVSINQPSSFILTIQIHSSKTLSPQDEQTILDQVIRMLRLTKKEEEELKKFQSLHPRAKEMGFGRLFRSPTLFEDALKTILLCNTTWKGTLKMVGQLCELQAKGKAKTTSKSRKRKRKRKGVRKERKIGNFPNAEEVCRMGIELLKQHCIGYRAPYVINFAQRVHNGSIDLQNLQQIQYPNQLPKIEGFGPFGTANLLMCLGFYHQLPIDTETKRHLKQVHGRLFYNDKTLNKHVKQIYDKYAPYQCLAYWLELVEYYETKFGKLSELCSIDYHKISGTTLNL